MKILEKIAELGQDLGLVRPDLKEANSAVNSSSFLLLLKNHKNVFTLFRLLEM